MKLNIKDPRITFFDFAKNLTIKDILIKIISISNGSYFILHSSSCINRKDRVRKQLNFLIKNPKFNAVSCLNSNFHQFHYHNHFRNDNEIDLSIIGGFIPLFLSSIMMTREILKASILNYKYNNMILNILSYTAIHKLSKYLCYSKIYYSSDSIKEISKFNHSKSIEYRNYYREILQSEPLSYNSTSIYKKRLLILIDSLNIGGTETYVFSLVKNLLKLNFYVCIASTGGIGENLYIHNNIDYFTISKNHDEAIIDLKNIVSKTSIDLIHCNLENSMYLGYSLYKELNIPYVITLHGTFYSSSVIAETCKCAKHIICISTPIYNKLLLSMPEYKPFTSIIYNGVDLTEISSVNLSSKYNIPLNNFIITYCSRLSYNKGLIAINVIKSLTTILQLNIDINLLIVGDGIKTPAIIELIDKINYSLKRSAIIYCSAIYNVRSVLSSSNIIIGTGRVLLEGLSVGKPSIAFGSSGFAGLVTETSTLTMLESYFGEHSNEDYSDDSLLDIVNDLYNSPLKRIEIGKWSKEWCSSLFDEVEMTKKIIEIYF